MVDATTPTGGQYYSWAMNVATNLQTTVVYGYPEVDPATHKVYSSMAIVNSAGLVKNYRKKYLFSSDTAWATPGPAFDYTDITFPRIGKTIRCGLAVCNDIWYIGSETY